MINECLTEDDLRRMLAESHTRPVLLLKHSTSCPISAKARREFGSFTEDASSVSCWMVLVIQQRALSQAITRETGVTHESPQALLINDGQVVWQASHYAITQSALAAAVQHLLDTHV